MTAALAGLGSGALHALSGPDHLLSLGPLAVGARRGAWRLGLVWGIGHGLASALAGALLVAAVSASRFPAVDAWAERVAGLALVGMGVAGLAGARRARHSPSTPGRAPPVLGVLAVGALHGLTGAAGLLLLLPAASAPGAHRILYLAGFGVGSTVAMAGLTALLAAVARTPRAGAIAARVPPVASAIAILAGTAWSLGAAG